MAETGAMNVTVEKLVAPTRGRMRYMMMKVNVVATSPIPSAASQVSGEVMTGAPYRENASMAELKPAPDMATTANAVGSTLLKLRVMLSESA